jgi:hypothetical protein
MAERARKFRPGEPFASFGDLIAWLVVRNAVARGILRRAEPNDG